MTGSARGGSGILGPTGRCATAWAVTRCSRARRCGCSRCPKEVIVPVVADDNSVDMGAFTLPQYVMAYDIKGFGVVGYEPFNRPVGAARDEFACTIGRAAGRV